MAICTEQTLLETPEATHKVELRRPLTQLDRLVGSNVPNNFVTLKKEAFYAAHRSDFLRCNITQWVRKDYYHSGGYREVRDTYPTVAIISHNSLKDIDANNRNFFLQYYQILPWMDWASRYGYKIANGSRPDGSRYSLVGIIDVFYYGKSIMEIRATPFSLTDITWGALLPNMAHRAVGNEAEKLLLESTMEYIGGEPCME